VTPLVAARVILGGAVVAPWLALLHLRGASGFALVMIAVVASLHGWGLLVKRLARIDEAPAALVVHWGLAATLALAGLAMMVHAGGHTTQLGLVLGGLVLHGALVIVDRGDHEARLVAFLRAADARYWMIPAIGLALVATLHVLGAAGDVTSSPFDDDGSLPAQLQRLWDTGTLADPIGFARGSQLGGHVVAGALITVLGGAPWFRVVDGLGFALLLWLALVHLRPRTPTASMWAVLLIFVAASYPSVATDAAPRWLAASLLLSLYVTFERYADPEDDRHLWPLGLVAAAVAVLRSELVPISVAIVASAGLVALGRSGGGRRGVALVVIPLAAVIPFLVVRIGARSSVPSGSLAALRHGGAMVVPGLMFLGILVVAIWGLVRTSSGPRRWIAIAAIAGLAGIAAQLTCTRPYATQFIWPIVVSATLAIGLGALRTAALEPRAIALVLSLVAAVLVYDGRDVPGRVRWSRRYTDLVEDLQYVSHAFPVAVRPDPYGPLLARVPAGATVVAWVARPELLDVAGHRIFDLRNPRAAARRASLIQSLHPDFLLFEDDHLPAERARRDLFYRLACPEGATEAYCLDDLQAIAAQHPSVATEGSVHLVRLRP
jgi:hypothetical protein